MSKDKDSINPADPDNILGVSLADIRKGLARTLDSGSIDLIKPGECFTHMGIVYRVTEMQPISGAITKTQELGRSDVLGLATGTARIYLQDLCNLFNATEHFIDSLPDDAAMSLASMPGYQEFHSVYAEILEKYATKKEDDKK